MAPPPRPQRAWPVRRVAHWVARLAAGGLATASAAWAQPAPPPPEPEPWPGEGRLEVQARAEPRQSGWRIHAQWEAPIGPGLSTRVQAQVAGGAAGREGPALGQAWLHAAADSPAALGGAGGLAWTVGRQRLAWGLTDTVSPTDLVNPPDWRDLGEVTRRPLAAAALHLPGLDLVLAEGGRARLPEGAWAPPAGTPDIQVAAERRTQWALRWQPTAILPPGHEAAVVLHQGPAHATVWALGHDGLLRASPSRQRALAAHWLAPLDGASLLRAEWGRFTGGPGPYTQWVLSLDREWSLTDGSGYLLLQHQDSRGTAVDPQAPDWRRALDGQTLARLQWRSDTGRSFALEGAGSRKPSGSQHLLRLAWHEPLGDGLALELTATRLHGPAGSFWGRWANRDRLGLTLRWVR